MRFLRARSILPDWKNAAASVAAALLLIGAFPDFEYWFLAWFALVPLMLAVEREKASVVKSFVLGWAFGTVFFFGTCWWLTFAPITYAGFPPALAYFLMFVVTAFVGIFPGIFACVLSVLLKRFGNIAIFAAPFIWVFTEFLRYWLTGNNWNAIGYSQAFCRVFTNWPAYGGVLLVSFVLASMNALWVRVLVHADGATLGRSGRLSLILAPLSLIILVLCTLPFEFIISDPPYRSDHVIAVQPNVPMSGLDFQKWQKLRQRQIDLAESEIKQLKARIGAYNDLSQTDNELKITVILPESPMNFMYEDDSEFQTFINGFARRNNVNVLFNSAEPDPSNGKFFNSAVLVGPEGKETAQYDKIYLLPFGESVPALFQSIVPAFVGSFSYGSEYDLLPLGDAKAGVMICFESHFGQLSREYVRNGADVIIEMTNDGYLGPTPVLRQHLANAVFRAVETNRPVLRVTNVGITAYINERGEVVDPAVPYTEDTRVWSVTKSDGGQTFYVKWGDWFAWLCSAVTLGLLILSLRRRQSPTATDIKA